MTTGDHTSFRIWRLQILDWRISRPLNPLPSRKSVSLVRLRDLKHERYPKSSHNLPDLPAQCMLYEEDNTCKIGSNDGEDASKLDPTRHSQL